MRRTLALLLAAWLALAATFAWAQDVQPVPALSGRVIDTTDTLTPAQVQAMSTKLAAIEAQRGSQVVVLMVASTLPEDIAQYAQRVADSWKIGRRDVGDGLLVVVAKNDRRIRIEVAKALEGAIPDVVAGRIISETIAPAFRQNDYAGGLNAAIDRLDARIGGEALPAPTVRESRGGVLGGFGLEDLAIFLFVAVPIVGAILRGIFGRKLGSLLTGGAVGGIGYLITTSLLVAIGAGLIAMLIVGIGFASPLSRGRRGGSGPVIFGGGWGGGGGGWSGGSDGGGFSSGGGGDFGGGGASGDW